MEMEEGAFEFGRYRLVPHRRMLSLEGQPVALGGRSFDLLTALVAHRHRPLGKFELKSLVWPEPLAVQDHVLTVTIATIRKLLKQGNPSLKFIATIAGQGYQFVAPVRPTAPEAPVPKQPEAAAPDHLIGRERDLAELDAAAAERRLVTLTGAGGVGKTRLALALVDRIGPRFPDGAWLIELASLADPHRVGEAIATRLGLTVRDDGNILESLTIFLRRKQLLLVLDNCEHLIAEASRIIETIAQACPHVTILATSRERLAIAGEFAYRVPSLDLPDSEAAELSPEAALRSSAIRLFVARAAAVDPGFGLTGTNAASVVRLCRRLDGLPLAIELAAGRLPAMAVEDLLGQLDDRMRPLAGSEQGKLARQQTLEAAIDWSYELLSDTERRFLNRLSVFADSFSVDLATKVAAEPGSALAVLTALVDKSLVMPLPASGGKRRLRLLESTKAYLRERLDAADRQACLRNLTLALASWYEEAARAWPTMATETWRLLFRADIENLRVALSWAFGPSGEPQLGVRLLAHTHDLWLDQSLLAEQQRWLAAAAPYIDGSVRAEIRAHLHLSAARRGYMGQRKYLEPAEQALALFRALGDRLHAAVALLHVGKALLLPTDMAEAEPHLREALAALRSFGPTKFLVTALHIVSTIPWYSGDHAEARDMLAESATLASGLGYGRGVSAAAVSLAEIDFATGRHAEAIARARAARAGCSAEEVVLAANIATNLATYLLVLGDAVGARAAARDGLGLALSLGSESWTALNIGHLGCAAAIDGEMRLAARLVGHAEAFIRTRGLGRDRNEEAAWRGCMARLQAALPAPALEALLAEGAALDVESVMALIPG